MKAAVRGVELYYEVHGAGPAILLVHGFPLSGRLWEHCVEPLKARYRLIIPDLRGLGRNQPVSQAGMADYADDLAALLDTVGETGPVVLIGLSMGGYIAFEFYRRHRDRVRAMVLADTRAAADTPDAARARAEMIRAVQARGAGVVADAMMPTLFGPRASDELKQTWRQIIGSSPPQSVIAALQAMKARSDSTETLASIDVPTLVIVGEDDALTPPTDARAVHRAIRGAKLKIIADAGHMTPVEQPARFVAAVQGFLDS